jgi:16S rRNA (cytosine1402-N4)-methyltransferase
MDIVNTWDRDDIANVLFGYGEERQSRKIADALIVARQSAPITTSTELASIVEKVIPRRGKTHPATKTFQALRIAVNDEFSVLETFISEAVSMLSSGGRLAIITFHSLEDRIVKNTFKDLARTNVGTLVHKKPIVASREECKENPRARSAKLRTIEIHEKDSKQMLPLPE